MQVVAWRNTQAGIDRRRAAAVPPVVPATKEQLEGLEAQLAAMMRRVEALEARPLQTIQIIQNVQGYVEPASPLRLGMQRIEARACKLFKIVPLQLRRDGRDQRSVFARQFVMYWAARMTTFSSTQIGKRLGGRDHTTVLAGVVRYVEKRKKMGRHLRRVR